MDSTEDRILEIYRNKPDEMIPIMYDEFKLYTNEAFKQHHPSQMFYIIDWKCWYVLSSWLEVLEDGRQFQRDVEKDFWYKKN